MKETKVYVDELPKSCYICPCYDTSEGFCSMTGSYIKYKKGRILQDCQLIDIKDHDRELVKEVCEDLTKSILNLKYVNDTRDFATYVLSIIKSKQKDFEK